MSDGVDEFPGTEEKSRVVRLDEYKPKKVEHVVTCECGEQHFYLHVHPDPAKVGDIECRYCGKFRTHLGWGYRNDD